MSTNVARFRLASVKPNRAAYRHRVSSYWNYHASDDRIGVRVVSHHQQQSQQQHSTSSRIAPHTRVTFFGRRSRRCQMLLVRVSPSGCKAEPKRSGIGVCDLLAKCWYHFESTSFECFKDFTLCILIWKSRGKVSNAAFVGSRKMKAKECKCFSLFSSIISYYVK